MPQEIAPLLRWSGSKAKLLPALENSAPKNYQNYIEPFAGSAALYFKIQPKASILGDINSSVVALYQAVAENPEKVHEHLASFRLDSNGYYSARSMDTSAMTTHERAARLIFLMKGCFNGVYRTNKSGQFNVPMGSRIYALPSRENLLAAAELLSGAHFISGDFLHSLAFAKRGDFTYLDPPYPSNGRYRGEYGYDGNFDQAQLRRLLDLMHDMDSRGVHVMFSYVQDSLVEKELANWQWRYESVPRSVAGSAKFRTRAKEVIITNYRDNM